MLIGAAGHLRCVALSPRMGTRVPVVVLSSVVRGRCVVILRASVVAGVGVVVSPRVVQDLKPGVG